MIAKAIARELIRNKKALSKNALLSRPENFSKNSLINLKLIIHIMGFHSAAGTSVSEVRFRTQAT